ncbi:MAG: SDR family oxidoreductase [bacterium]|nr:SDR family oxidoreductase [bacterium]
MKENRSVIIIGVSSGIGQALSRKWLNKGWKIFGTYRTEDQTINELKNLGAIMVHCDLASSLSTSSACRKLKKICSVWDVLVICPASLEPIGLFVDLTVEDWADSIQLNFINQIKMVHQLLPSRRIGSSLGSCVLFFSGGGINDAPTHYSAYTVSKIATIKMAEILDVEIPDTRFISIGPGWVDTKIHDQTIKAGSKAGPNYNRTVKKIEKKDFTPIDRIINCCDWVINASKKVVGGRNINVLYDNWGNKELERKLTKDHHLFKLRKYGSIKK